MKYILFLSIFIVSSCSTSDEEYLCFFNPDDMDEKICYLSTEKSDKDLTAKNALKELENNIDNPGSLVKMKGEMKESYTQEKFNKSFKKHYKDLSYNNILHTQTHNNDTAIYLNDNSTLYYSHTDSAFIFSYDQPLSFEGANSYFGHGFHPEKATFSPKHSICNLKKQGVIYLSPSKENVYFNEDKSFCTYKGMYLIKTNSEIMVRRVDQIGSNVSTISNVGFKNFLLWISEKS